MSRQMDKLMCLVKFARDSASLSCCKRAQCGAIVFPADLSGVYEIGHNGPAARLPNDSCRDTEGACGCCHAEANTIAKLDSRRIRHAVMYSTTAPCELCAGLIVNCGAIDLVIYTTPYRNTLGVDLLEAAGIRVVRLGLSSDEQTEKHVISLIEAIKLK